MLTRFSSRAAPLLGVLGAGLALGACQGSILEPASPGLEDFNKVADLRTENGNLVEFFEPAPGNFFIIEHASRTSPAATGKPELKGLGPAALYRKLSPGTDAPAELVRLEAQMAAQPARAPREPSSPPRREVVVGAAPATGSDIETTQQPLTSGEFTRKHCACQWGDSFVCWLNASGFNRDEVEDVQYYDGEINGVKGKVKLTVDIRTWWSWSRKANIDVNANDEKRFYWGAQLDYDVRADITEADGDIYHYRGVGFNGPAQACP
jgi:hypothetical protein